MFKQNIHLFLFRIVYRVSLPYITPITSEEVTKILLILNFNNNTVLWGRKVTFAWVDNPLPLRKLQTPK
jgi:hypothetical protein